jgi:hypothetical protein
LQLNLGPKYRSIARCFECRVVCEVKRRNVCEPVVMVAAFTAATPTNSGRYVLMKPVGWSYYMAHCSSSPRMSSDTTRSATLWW